MPNSAALRNAQKRKKRGYATDDELIAEQKAWFEICGVMFVGNRD